MRFWDFLFFGTLCYTLSGSIMCHKEMDIVLESSDYAKDEHKVMTNFGESKMEIDSLRDKQQSFITSELVHENLKSIDDAKYWKSIYGKIDDIAEFDKPSIIKGETVEVTFVDESNEGHLSGKNDEKIGDKVSQSIVEPSLKIAMDSSRKNLSRNRRSSNLSRDRSERTNPFDLRKQSFAEDRKKRTKNTDRNVENREPDKLSRPIMARQSRSRSLHHHPDDLDDDLSSAGRYKKSQHSCPYADSHGSRRRSNYKFHPNVISSDKTCDDVFLGHCQRHSQYRTIDGSCNNLKNPTWGMAGTRYARLLPAIYSDGIHAPARSTRNHELPAAREISYTLHPEVRIPDPKWTLVAMQYGQFIAHDMALFGAPENSREGSRQCCVDGRVRRELLGDDQCMLIIVPKNDPVYNNIQCLAFTRGITDQDSGCPLRKLAAEQLTTVTHYLDLSVVYGSSHRIARSLRSWYGGRLNIDVRDKREWPPRAPNSTMTCSPDIGGGVCYATGDERANQSPQLTVLHIILVREHNRVAKILAKINPHWNDETTYQETRRILIAMNQQIAYYEWLPIFIGKRNSYDHKIIYPTNGYVDDYDSKINPSVLNEHSSAAFRGFHTLIAGYLKLVGENRRDKSALRLSDWFMKPGIIEMDENMDDLIRGMSTQPQQAKDKFFDEEVTQYLFRGRNPLGVDLRAIDIQRNRDHGLATYNDLREYCGLPRAVHWKQLEDVIDKQNIEKLAQLYESPEDIDLTVGGSLEFLVKGTLSGPTVQCILNEQFYRTRVGDRFWFESPDRDVGFTTDQLKEIKKASLARWFCDNGDRVRNIQAKGFELPSKTNPIKSCRDIPEMDLSLWKDYAVKFNSQRLNSDYQNHGGVYYRK